MVIGNNIRRRKLTVIIINISSSSSTTETPTATTMRSRYTNSIDTVPPSTMTISKTQAIETLRKDNDGEDGSVEENSRSRRKRLVSQSVRNIPSIYDKDSEESSSPPSSDKNIEHRMEKKSDNGKRLEASRRSGRHIYPSKNSTRSIVHRTFVYNEALCSTLYSITKNKSTGEVKENRHKKATEKGGLLHIIE